MGSVGDTWICSLCRRWAPWGGHPLYDSGCYVPLGCGRCSRRFWDAGLPCWQDMFLLQPLQKLGFCNKPPMSNCREAWILILEFMAGVPFRGKAMPCGVPLFLWYDDMVCHNGGPEDLFMRFPQIPEVLVVEKMIFVPPPQGKCRVPLQLHRSRSAPALLCGVWRRLPPHGHTKRFEVLIETLRRPNRPPEPLLIRPSGPQSLHFRLAVGLRCEPDAIWELRRQVQYPEWGFSYQEWHRRKMRWRVEKEAAEQLLRLPPGRIRTRPPYYPHGGDDERMQPARRSPALQGWRGPGQ